MSDFAETETLFRQSAPLAGKLRVDVPSRIGRRIIAPALPEFLDQHPPMEIEIGVTDRPIDLIQEGVDCVIRVGELEDSRLVARRIGQLMLINCASAGYLAHYGKPTKIEDLNRHMMIGYASPLSSRIDEWEYADDGQLKTVAVPRRATVNSAETYIACCLAGLGPIQVPAYDVREYLASGELVEVLPELRPVPMPIALVYPSRQHLSRRLRAFMDWVVSLFETHRLLDDTR